MVFTKTFWNDIKEKLLPIISKHYYIMDEITWENLIIRAMKTDDFIWENMGKPINLPMDVWKQIRIIIKSLAENHNINIHDEIQNSQRECLSFWHNIDDPNALHDFMNKRFTNLNRFFQIHKNIKIISDIIDQAKNIRVNCTQATTICMVNCGSFNSENKIIIESTLASNSKPAQYCKNLFYNIQLKKPSTTLTVPPNHLTVMIDGEIYSVSMAIMTKNQLKSQAVYQYKYNDRTNNYDKKSFCLFEEFSATLTTEPGCDSNVTNFLISDIYKQKTNTQSLSYFNFTQKQRFTS